jgi:hypothetical protein
VLSSAASCGSGGNGRGSGNTMAFMSANVSTEESVCLASQISFYSMPCRRGSGICSSSHSHQTPIPFFCPQTCRSTAQLSCTGGAEESSRYYALQRMMTTVWLHIYAHTAA